MVPDRTWHYSGGCFDAEGVVTCFKVSTSSLDLIGYWKSQCNIGKEVRGQTLAMIITSKSLIAHNHWNRVACEKYI